MRLQVAPSLSQTVSTRFRRFQTFGSGCFFLFTQFFAQSPPTESSRQYGETTGALRRVPDSMGKQPEPYGEFPTAWGSNRSPTESSRQHGETTGALRRVPDSVGKQPELYGEFPTAWGNNRSSTESSQQRRETTRALQNIRNIFFQS